MKVVGADDAGWPVCKDCFRDVVRDTQCRQSRTHCAAQIVVDPTGERDGVMILAATTGQRLERPLCCRRERSARCPDHSPARHRIKFVGRYCELLVNYLVRQGTVVGNLSIAILSHP